MFYSWVEYFDQTEERHVEGKGKEGKGREGKRHNGLKSKENQRLEYNNDWNWSTMFHIKFSNKS